MPALCALCIIIKLYAPSDNCRLVSCCSERVYLIFRDQHFLPRFRQLSITAPFGHFIVAGALHELVGSDVSFHLGQGFKVGLESLQVVKPVKQGSVFLLGSLSVNDVSLINKIETERTNPKKGHVIENLPEHEVDISQRCTSDKLVVLHVRIKLLQLRLERVLAVTLTLIKRSSA